VGRELGRAGLENEAGRMAELKGLRRTSWELRREHEREEEREKEKVFLFKKQTKFKHTFEFNKQK
jgi:hypothetical protein